MTPALEIKDLRAGYDAADVLHGISLTVGPQECVGLFGPNGHGKTTLLRALSRLMPLRSGQVRLFGNDTGGRSARALVAEGLVHVPQANQLFPDMAILEILELAAHVPSARGKTAETLDYVLKLFPRLAERRRQDCKTLSGGERQMLAIGVGLMCEPRMLMLDEPTLGLSPKLKEELAAAIGEISARGLPVLLVEQDVTFVMSLVSRLYFVDHGEIAHEISRENAIGHDEIMEMYFGGKGAQ